MATSEVFNATVFPPGYWASGGIDDLGVYIGASAGAVAARLTGTLTAVGDLATVTIGGTTLTLRAYSDIPGGVLFTTTDFATFYAFLGAPFSPTVPYTISYTVAGNSGLACFLAGTRIETAHGPIPVERLRPGLRVRTLRWGWQPVRWLGWRRLLPAGAGSWPIRIAPHAFGPGRPFSPLLLSPDHAVFCGGGLIPVRYLVNGATIAPQPMRAVEYWHVELPRHDILLAEGLPTESYLDTGNRGAFDNAAAAAPPSAMRARRIWARRACAPLLLDRAAQALVRRRLLARAAALGHRLTDDPALDVRAGDVALPLRRNGTVWRATVPPGLPRVWLHSRSAVPAEIFAAGTDTRRLGLAVTRLVLDGKEVPPPARSSGWYRPETGLQWTDGCALVLCDTNTDRPRILEIACAPLLRYWLSSSPGMNNQA